MEAEDLIDRLRADWLTEQPSLDTSPMDVVGRLIVLGEVLRRRVDATLAPLGLGYSEFGVLATLHRQGEPCELRPAELLQTVLLQSGSLTACLDRLESRSLVRRALDENDRRARVVRLTPKGRELVTSALTLRLDQARDFLIPLDESEREALAALLKKLVLVHRPLPPTTGPAR